MNFTSREVLALLNQSGRTKFNKRQLTALRAERLLPKLEGNVWNESTVKQVFDLYDFKQWERRNEALFFPLWLYGHGVQIESVRHDLLQWIEALMRRIFERKNETDSILDRLLEGTKDESDVEDALWQISMFFADRLIPRWTYSPRRPNITKNIVDDFAQISETLFDLLFVPGFKLEEYAEGADLSEEKYFLSLGTKLHNLDHLLRQENQKEGKKFHDKFITILESTNQCDGSQSPIAKRLISFFVEVMEEDDWDDDFLHFEGDSLPFTEIRSMLEFLDRIQQVCSLPNLHQAITTTTENEWLQARNDYYVLLGPWYPLLSPFSQIFPLPLWQKVLMRGARILFLALLLCRHHGYSHSLDTFLEQYQNSLTSITKDPDIQKFMEQIALHCNSSPNKERLIASLTKIMAIKIII